MSSTGEVPTGSVTGPGDPDDPKRVQDPQESWGMAAAQGAPAPTRQRPEGGQGTTDADFAGLDDRPRTTEAANSTYSPRGRVTRPAGRTAVADTAPSQSSGNKVSRRGLLIGSVLGGLGLAVGAYAASNKDELFSGNSGGREAPPAGEGKVAWNGPAGYPLVPGTNSEALRSVGNIDPSKKYPGNPGWHPTSGDVMVNGEKVELQWLYPADGNAYGEGEQHKYTPAEALSIFLSHFCVAAVLPKDSPVRKEIIRYLVDDPDGKREDAGMTKEAYWTIRFDAFRDNFWRFFTDETSRNIPLWALVYDDPNNPANVKAGTSGWGSDLYILQNIRSVYFRVLSAQNGTKHYSSQDPAGRVKAESLQAIESMYISGNTSTGTTPTGKEADKFGIDFMEIVFGRGDADPNLKGSTFRLAGTAKLQGN